MEENSFCNLSNIEISESNYYDFLLHKNNFLGISQISTKEVFLLCQNSSFFMNKIRNFQTEYIYPSEMHGVSHNVRVAMLSYYMALNLGLNFREQELIIDASLYHDTGRVNDIDDIYHGDRSAEKIEQIILDKDKDYMKQLKIVVICHSHDDEEMDVLIKRSKIDFQRTKLLVSILKDSDALDRIRFDGLDPNYLRLDISKNLLNASAGLFFTYKKFLENNV